MFSSILFCHCVKDDSKAKRAQKDAPKKARFAEEPERELGKGAMGDLLKREYRKSRMINEVRQNMAHLTTYRLVPTQTALY